MAIRKRVAFTVDKHGNPRAYRWCPSGVRFFPMGYGAAQLAVATGAAEVIPFRVWKPQPRPAGR